MNGRTGLLQSHDPPLLIDFIIFKLLVKKIKSIFQPCRERSVEFHENKQMYLPNKNNVQQQQKKTKKCFFYFTKLCDLI